MSCCQHCKGFYIILYIVHNRTGTTSTICTCVVNTLPRVHNIKREESALLQYSPYKRESQSYDAIPIVTLVGQACIQRLLMFVDKLSLSLLIILTVTAVATIGAVVVVAGHWSTGAKEVLGPHALNNVQYHNFN